MFAQARQGTGLGAENSKPSISCSVLAVPRLTEKEGDREKWWGAVDKVVVVGAQSDFNCRRGEVGWWCLPYTYPTPSFPPHSLPPSILPIPSYKPLGVLGTGHGCLHRVVVEG